MTTDTPQFIDALPYIDTAIDDDENQRALAMREVDNEIDIFPPDTDYLQHLPFRLESRTFCTPLIENEHRAIELNECRPPASDLAALRAEMPPRDRGVIDDEEFAIWANCLDQVKLRLEYGQRQLANLELMKTYGDLAWEQCIRETEVLGSALKAGLADLERRTQEVNWKRKSDQERVAKQLDVLHREWLSLEERNRVLFKAIGKL